jgi:hypothetical protein
LTAAGWVWAVAYRTVVAGVPAIEECLIAAAVAVLALEVQVGRLFDAAAGPSAAAVVAYRQQAPGVELLEAVLWQGKRSSHGLDC